MMPRRIAFSFLLAFVFCPLQVQAGWNIQSEHRKLHYDHQYSDYAFVFSVLNDTEWCITGSSTPQHHNLVRSQPCDFASASPTQLWLHKDGKFRSMVDSSLCLRIYSKIYDQGNSRVRVTPCDEDTSLNLFDFENDNIVLREDNSFCLTNHGVPPREGAPMIARECTMKPRFRFFVAHPEDYAAYIGLCNDDSVPTGCLVVEDEDPTPGQSLILGTHDLNHDWRQDDHYLFHSALDDNMCMQAGSGSDPPTDGTPIKLYPCDATNPRQFFNYDGVDIEHLNSGGLCVGFRGDNSHVQVDPIILKDCDRNGNNWSTD